MLVLGMPALSESRLSDLLQPFLQAELPAPKLAQTPLPELLPRLSAYLDLLLRWNARTNLTAVRDPEAMVSRHFGESLFAGRLLATVLQPGETVLDFGSGAGFPGLPLALLLPELHVTLAESQGKKAAFLQEAVRTLGLKTEVWPRRTELMPAGRLFTAVTLRAVDKMDDALQQARTRVTPGGWMLALSADSAATSVLIPGTIQRYASFAHL